MSNQRLWFISWYVSTKFKSQPTKLVKLKMAFVNHFDELVQPNLEQDFVQMHPSAYGSYPDSVGSPGSEERSPYFIAPNSEFYYPPVPTEQVFFPPNFNPTEYSQQWDYRHTEMPHFPTGTEGVYPD